jgi:hypothetical protein
VLRETLKTQGNAGKPHAQSSHASTPPRHAPGLQATTLPARKITAQKGLNQAALSRCFFATICHVEQKRHQGTLILDAFLKEQPRNYHNIITTVAPKATVT